MKKNVISNYFDGVDQSVTLFSPSTSNNDGGEGNGFPNRELRSEILYNIDPYSSNVDEAGHITLQTPDVTNARMAIRQDDWKLILNEFCLGWFRSESEMVMLDDGSSSLSDCRVQGCAVPSGTDAVGKLRESFLFNLREDPYEQHNLIEDFPEVAEGLQELLMNKYALTMVPTAWVPTEKSASEEWEKEGFIGPWH